MKKSQSITMVEAEGVILALLLYIGIQLFLAFLSIRSVVPEKHLAVLQLLSCMLSVFLGGIFSARRAKIGSLSASMLVAALFAMIQLFVGFVIFKKITWAGQGGHLLLCTIAGGILAGLAAAQASKKGKSHATRKTRIRKNRQK